MSRPSPLQNRVAPDGTLHAVDARGLLMGNRGGRLHGDDARLGRARWRSRAWIACEIAFRGRHRAVMGDGYTELFFLDEATALAAGHRPCFECRRADARAFAAAWSRATGAATPPRAPEMDAVLHRERRAARVRAPIETVPPGAVVASGGRFWLRGTDGLRAWSFSGYRWPAGPLPAEVEVVTPPAVSAVLAAGYRPRLHPSARA